MFRRKSGLALAARLREASLLGYRKQWPVAGKPDFAWPGLKVAVFVQFWRQQGWRITLAAMFVSRSRPGAQGGVCCGSGSERSRRLQP